MICGISNKIEMLGYIIENWIMHIMSQLVFIKYYQPGGSE